MLTSLEEGLNVVFYSKTHKKLPQILHESRDIQLELPSEMVAIFDGYLVHSGGTSRSDDDAKNFAFRASPTMLSNCFKHVARSFRRA